MKLERLSDSNTLFSKLPSNEVKFLLESTNKVLGKVKDGSLESLLKQINSIFSDKEYGWEEAILNGEWYRYPSEIKTQRFCSEEALKNYLLIRTLGIPVTYAIVENYDNRGMWHEVNLVPEGSRLHLVDWKLSTVKVSDKSFEKEDGTLIPFDKIIYLTEDELLERVKALRSGRSFLDAIECGQILYTKEFSVGELEAFVEYHPQEREIGFLYALTKVPGGIKFYFLDKLRIHENGITHANEQGVIHGENIRANRVPLLSFGQDGPSVDNIGKVIDQLNEDTRWRIGAECIYDINLGTSQAQEWQFVYSKPERQKALHKMRLKNRLSQNVKYEVFLRNYDLLRKHSKMAAQRYLDASLVNGQLRNQFNDREGMDKYFSKLYHMDSSSNLGLTFYLINMVGIGHLLNVEHVYDAQKRLWQVLCQRFGITQSEYYSSNILESVPAISKFLKGVLDESISYDSIKVAVDKENRNVIIRY